MSCTGFFDEYISWAKEHPTHVVRFVLTSNQKNQVCSYATGLLGYSPGLPAPVTPSPTPISHATLHGERITQVFSDRKSGDQPFDNTAPDTLGVRITPETAHVALTLSSWGDARMSFPVDCDSTAGVLYGFAQGTMFVISLSKELDPSVA